MTSDTSCPCSGQYLAKLIHPSVLTFLIQGDLHGYEILHRFSGLRLFQGSRPDARGVYRALKSMEDGGYVRSSWAATEAGRAKRLYHITDDGVECVRQWIATLRSYRLALDKLLTVAEDAFLVGRSRVTTHESGQ